jgi:type VI secretion system secreted protein Hcp
MAVDMFLKLGDLKGESLDKEYKDHFDVLAWSWGASQSGTTHMGGGGGAGKVSVQDISITKWVDAGTPTMLGACCSGKHFPEGFLVCRKAGGDSPIEYIKIELKEILITSVSTGGSGGEDKLTENVSLNFQSFKLSYQPQDEKGGKKGGAIDTSWNMASNEPKFSVA